MTEHLTNRQIESYHRRVLDPAELIELDEHLTVCADCRRELSSIGQGKDKFVSLKSNLDSTSITEHMDHEQLAAYAEGTLQSVELEIVESHLANCGECELVASDLVVFKDEVAQDLGIEYAPRVEVIQQPTPQSSPNRLSTFLSSLFAINSPAVAFGMGALAMLIIGGLVWLIVRSNRTGTKGPQIVQTASPTPTATPQNGAQASVSPIATPSPSPQILLALNDGAKQVGIDEGGNLVGLEDLPPGAKEMVKTALITQQAANLAALTGVGGPQGSLRGGENQGPGFVPLSPVGKVIFSTNPTLRWSKLEGATDYRVEIYDSNFGLVASSTPLTTNSWNLPHVLNRGEIYSWQVTATKDGVKIKSPVPPAPEAKFKILDVKLAADVTVARKNYAGSHLALGVLFGQSGLLDEAETEFSALMRANPQSEVARKLLNNVRGARTARMK